MAAYPSTTPPTPTYRLVPSRFPTIGAFDDVVAPDDLLAVTELEGWTNDRLVLQRINRLPQSDWVFGASNSSVIMAAFLHAPLGGTRFASGDLGAWYGAYSQITAVIEVAHHLRREAVNTGMMEMRGQYREYLADLSGTYVDIRGQQDSLPKYYGAGSYAEGPLFGKSVRQSSRDGIAYDSVRHQGGTNIVCYRPRSICNVRQGAHFEITVRPEGKVIVRQLKA